MAFFLRNNKKSILKLIAVFVAAFLAGWCLACFFIWQKAPEDYSWWPYFWPF